MSLKVALPALLVVLTLFAGMVVAQRAHEAANPMPVIELTASSTQVIMVPEDCEAVVSAIKNRAGLFITYTSRKGYERMAQYEYQSGAWKITHTYLFARKKK
jgi:hypothetical protein